ncbi:Restriction endonuclease type II-like protein [Rhypophila sp. PSN 637]
MDDDFGDDADFLAALEATEARVGNSRPPNPQPHRPQQPQPQNLQQRQPPRIQQPTPQRLDRAPPSVNSSGPPGAGPNKIVQPTPQVLPNRGSGSSILVSPRQKGNPVIACLKSIPWEYSDIPADYGLGLTTCALFLSLKYHRLHPEYIYTRIRNLQGKYLLRILLTMVDIPNHEDSLRELSKTSVVNNVTVILCWSAAEAARYLELYKSYEHASFAAIRGQQATGYAEKMVEFVTVPRSINKADAVALVGTFGSLKHAVNADTEQVSVVGGWGERKVKAWCKAVEQPFRVKKAAKRKAGGSRPQGSGTVGNALDDAIPISRVPLRDMVRTGAPVVTDNRSTGPGASRSNTPGRAETGMLDVDEEDALIAASMADTTQPNPQAPREAPKPVEPSREDVLSDGIAAALAKLRQSG